MIVGVARERPWAAREPPLRETNIHCMGINSATHLLVIRLQIILDDGGTGEALGQAAGEVLS
jgi:hypothetical protein